jgi:hypothetical protein
MNEHKITKRFLLILIVSLISFNGIAQDDTTKDKMEYPDHTLHPAAPPPEEIFYRGSLQLGGGLVYAITNTALRRTLGGVYFAHASGDYVIAQHIYGGLELENAQFGNTEYGANINTLMFFYNVGVKIGYYTFMKNDFLFCYSLSGGPSEIVFFNAPNPAPKGGFREKSFFLTPNLLAAYRVNNELRIGLEITYAFLGYRYDPTLTGVQQYLDPYDPKWANFPVTYFEWGFGLYYAFKEEAHRTISPEN